MPRYNTNSICGSLYNYLDGDLPELKLLAHAMTINSSRKKLLPQYTSSLRSGTHQPLLSGSICE